MYYHFRLTIQPNDSAPPNHANVTHSQVQCNASGSLVWLITSAGRVYCRTGVQVDDLPVGEHWIEVGILKWTHCLER